MNKWKSSGEQAETLLATYCTIGSYKNKLLTHIYYILYLIQGKTKLILKTLDTQKKKV